MYFPKHSSMSAYHFYYDPNLGPNFSEYTAHSFGLYFVLNIKYKYNI